VCLRRPDVRLNGRRCGRLAARTAHATAEAVRDAGQEHDDEAEPERVSRPSTEAIDLVLQMGLFLLRAATRAAVANVFHEADRCVLCKDVREKIAGYSDEGEDNGEELQGLVFHDPAAYRTRGEDERDGSHDDAENGANDHAVIPVIPHVVVPIAVFVDAVAVGVIIVRLVGVQRVARPALLITVAVIGVVAPMPRTLISCCAAKRKEYDKTKHGRAGHPGLAMLGLWSKKLWKAG